VRTQTVQAFSNERVTLPGAILVILLDSSHSAFRLRIFFNEGTLVSRFSSRPTSTAETSPSNFFSLSWSVIRSRPPDADTKPLSPSNAYTVWAR